jgi:hypothetical protein
MKFTIMILLCLIWSAFIVFGLQLSGLNSVITSMIGGVASYTIAEIIWEAIS